MGLTKKRNRSRNGRRNFILANTNLTAKRHNEALSVSGRPIAGEQNGLRRIEFTEKLAKPLARHHSIICEPLERAGAPTKKRPVHFFFARIQNGTNDTVKIIDSRRNGMKRGNTDNGYAGTVRKALYRAQADTQAGERAGTDGDGESRNIAQGKSRSS
jgi:hypothetical protein